MATSPHSLQISGHELFTPPPLITGRYYDLSLVMGIGGLNTLAVAANTLYGRPIWLRKGDIVAAISINVSTLAAGSARLGLYQYDPTTGSGGALIIDAGTVSTGTTGVKDATTGLPWTCTATDYFYMVAVFDATPTVTVHTGTSVNNPTAPWGYASVADSIAAKYVKTRSFTFAALPDPFGASSDAATNVPRIMIKAG